MNKRIKHLIVEYGDKIMPYLKLRAEISESENYVVRDRLKHKISENDLNDLVVSGFVSVQESPTRQTLIYLKSDEGWLADPPEIKVRERKESKEWTPTTLFMIVDMIGRPIDWMTKKSRYRAQYISLSKKYTDDELLQTAEKFKGIDEDIFLPGNELGQLLSEDGLKTIRDYEIPKDMSPNAQNYDESDSPF